MAVERSRMRQMTEGYFARKEMVNGEGAVIGRERDAACDGTGGGSDKRGDGGEEDGLESIGEDNDDGSDNKDNRRNDPFRPRC